MAKFLSPIQVRRVTRLCGFCREVEILNTASSRAEARDGFVAGALWSYFLKYLPAPADPIQISRFFQLDLAVDEMPLSAFSRLLRHPAPATRYGDTFLQQLS